MLLPITMPLSVTQLFPQLISDSQRIYSSFFICVTVFFLFADQNLLAPNLSMIADEFNFNDMERDEKLGGNISFGFFVLGAPAALIVGYLADSCNRCQLFGYVVILGEMSCLATYWVRSYTELFICRVLTGISIGGAAPVIFSLLADYWPGSSRVKMNTLVGIAMSAGIAGGQLIAGLMGPSYGWRSPFLVISVPCLLSALLILTTTIEPNRGEQEEEVLKMQRKHFANTDERKNVEITLSCRQEEMEENKDLIGTVGNPLQPDLILEMEQSQETESEIATGGPENGNHELFEEDLKSKNDAEEKIVESRSKDELQEDSSAYKEQIDWTKCSNIFLTPTVALLFIQAIPGCLPWDRGLSVELATAALVLFGAGGFIGQFFGGAFGQYLYNRDKRLQGLLMGSTTIVAVFPMLYLINADVVGDALFYIIALIAGITISINGTAFAFFNLADDLGKGAGPVLVVALVKACNGVRRKAFNIVILFWVFCGIVLLLIIFTVEKDENAVQDKVRYSIERQSTLWESHQEQHGSPLHGYARVDTEVSERTPVKQNNTELI